MGPRPALAQLQGRGQKFGGGGTLGWALAPERVPCSKAKPLSLAPIPVYSTRFSWAGLTRKIWERSFCSQGGLQGRADLGKAWAAWAGAWVDGLQALPSLPPGYKDCGFCLPCPQRVPDVQTEYTT